MSDPLAILTLLAGMAGSVAAHVYAWNVLGPRERLPLAVFSGSYVITSAFSATLIGVFGLAYVEEMGYGISTQYLQDIGSAKYWLLVYLPLVMLPVITAQICGARKKGDIARPILARDYCMPSVFLIGLTLASVYCSYCLVSAGGSLSLSSWSNLSQEYFDLIDLRRSITASVGPWFLRLVYVALPAMSFVALYQLNKHRTVTWWVLFATTALVTAWMGLATIQKSLLLVYVASLGAGLVVLGIAKYRHMLYVGLAGCFLLTLMQQFFMHEWTFTQSLMHVTHRVGHAVPYYIAMYPEHIPYEGLETGLWLFGHGTPPADNKRIFECMYPGLQHVSGHAVAASHLRMYAQAGIPGALLGITVVGVLIGIISRLARQIGGPISFAFYLQALVVIYYATQISLLDMLLSSYGMAWVVLSLGPLWFVNQMASGKTYPASHRPPRTPEPTIAAN